MPLSPLINQGATRWFSFPTGGSLNLDIIPFIFYVTRVRSVARFANTFDTMIRYVKRSVGIRFEE